MLVTVLSVLKIIGIVLAAILGLALFVIILVLFCPFVYRIRIEKKDKLIGFVRLRFLFPLVQAVVQYDEIISFQIRLLGIKLVNKEKNIKASENEAEQDALEEDFKEGVSEEEKTKENSIEEESFEKEAVNKAEGIEALEDDLTNEADSRSASTDETEKKKKKHFFARKEKNFFEFWQGIFNKIREFLEKPKSFIDSLAEKYVYYEHLLNTKGSKYVIEYLKKELLLVLKHLKPKKAKGSVIYGSDDPAKSAKMYEIYILLMNYLPIKINYTPVFDREELQLDVDIRGFFCLYYLAFHALKIILNKKVRRFIKLLKRED